MQELNKQTKAIVAFLKDGQKFAAIKEEPKVEAPKLEAKPETDKKEEKKTAVTKKEPVVNKKEANKKEGDKSDEPKAEEKPKSSFRSITADNNKAGKDSTMHMFDETKNGVTKTITSDGKTLYKQSAGEDLKKLPKFDGADKSKKESKKMEA